MLFLSRVNFLSRVFYLERESKCSQMHRSLVPLAFEKMPRLNKALGPFLYGIAKCMFSAGVNFGACLSAFHVYFIICP